MNPSGYVSIKGFDCLKNKIKVTYNFFFLLLINNNMRLCFGGRFTSLAAIRERCGRSCYLSHIHITLVSLK